jgi:hypothetical protein
MTVIPGRASSREPGIHTPGASVWMLNANAGVMDSGARAKSAPRNDE